MDYEHLARVGARDKTTKKVWFERGLPGKFVVTVVSRNPHFTPRASMRVVLSSPFDLMN